MLKIDYSLAREKIYNEEGHNHLKIDINVDTSKKSKREKPVAVMMCIDNSGSMGVSLNGGYINYHQPFFNNNIHTFLPDIPKQDIFEQRKSKMDYVKDSTIEILHSLKEDDYFGVVIFDDLAHVIVELDVIGDRKKEIERAIKNIQVSGCTNMFDGLRKVEREFDKLESKEITKKLIVLSDGEVNSGVTDLDSFATKSHQLFNKKQIQVSTVGFGRDYNLELMSLIAKKGEGNFYHLKESEQIYQIIEEELDTINSILAYNAELVVKVPIGFTFEENLNDFTEEYDENKIIIKLGNISYSKSMIFPISLLKKLNIEEVKIPITLTYKNEENDNISLSKDVIIKITDNKEENISENKDLVDEVSNTIQRKAILDATIEYEKTGNYSNATQFMEKSLGNLSTMYNSVESSAYLNNFTATLSSNTADVDSLRNLNASIRNTMKRKND